MKKLIKKYEAKLEFLNKSLEENKMLLDTDTLDMMQDVGELLKEMISDLRNSSNES